MLGKGDTEDGSNTQERRRSPAAVKASSKIPSKKMIQARLPFKRMNPVCKENDRIEEGKKVKIAQNVSPPNKIHLLDASMEDQENDYVMETELLLPLPKTVNGKGPIDQYLTKTLKTTQVNKTITIDLTEDSNSSISEPCPINGGSQMHLTDRTVLSECKPRSPTPQAEIDTCTISVKTPERMDNMRMLGQSPNQSVLGDVKVPLGSQNSIRGISLEETASSKLSADMLKEIDSSEEDSPPPSSTCSPVSVSSPENQADPQEKHCSPSAAVSPESKIPLPKLSSEKKRLKEKEHEEKKRKLQSEKEEKERAKEEARAARERVKEEAKKKKDEEREQREKEKREKKEKEDREKAEKLRLKEEKKKEKLEALEAKQEEKRKREEEKRMKEEEKRMKAEKAEIRRFFQKPKMPLTPKTIASFCGKFAPFEIKKNMAVAPLCRVEFNTDALEQLDKYLQDPNSEQSFLDELKTRKPRRMGRTVVPQVTVMNSDMICSYVDEVQVVEDSDQVPCNEELVKQASVPERQPFGRMKLLQFCENYRPAYWGTWNRKSGVICPRKPWALDTKLLDYEADSDEEWEEEEPGESLSHSEGDDDDEPKEEEEEDDDGFFVPHGYLSEDEGGASDEERADPENEKVRQCLKAKEWAELLSKGKKFRVLQPVVIGCIWQDSREAEVRRLQKFTVCILESPSAEEEVTPETVSCRKLNDRQILSQLLPLLHGNVNGSKMIIHEFQECCRMGLFSEADTSITTESVATSPSSPNSAAPQTPNITIPSKARLKRIISENSVYEKRPDHRMCWYVHSEVLKSFEQEHLPVPCQWTYITHVNNSKEDSGTPVASMQIQTVSSKRKSAGSMPITKFMKRAKEISKEDVMDIDGFQADTEEEENDDCIVVDEQQNKVAEDPSTAYDVDVSLGDAAVTVSSLA
ncbi:chromatin assembly factor 1 subunit A [Spea bombifrons]|uniref:chromatin assembly factor 1 subunit A n=1 Tax=Spea bombifrons TaxID=233779 RepID=UPI00234BAEB9|nr:chromatin assembly factor 1 subunit A [Spea bombifrons]